MTKRRKWQVWAWASLATMALSAVPAFSSLIPPIGNAAQVVFLLALGVLLISLMAAAMRGPGRAA